MYDSREGPHGNTAVVTHHWFITLCMLGISSESVDWNDRKSQERVVAIAASLSAQMYQTAFVTFATMRCLRVSRVC